MSTPRQAHIIEVGTRDGIQAEKQFVETEQKLHMLELILAAGVRRGEAT
ncbi:MAG: hydroxymethylglutaryl-CoA lyase, partial [Nitrospinaceae bacterium]|nr:hydroxymethylglutaryl-CoA lyase [Nitrospinaceae bacterium]